jgi:hypothetical protein
MIGIIIFIIALSASIAWLWAGGIDYMKKNHPDYKGKDFLDWDEKDNGWDDNKNHTEGEF